MSYNYNNEFFTALNNTKNLGFHEDVKEFSDKNYFENGCNQLLLDLFPVFQWISKEKSMPGLPGHKQLIMSIISNCGPFHNYIKPIVEKLLNCKAYITVGYIKVGDIQEMHKIDLQTIENSIKNKRFPSQHHVWLTLDSGEILDLTFQTTFDSLHNSHEFNQALDEGYLPISTTCRSTKDLKNGFEYHPVVIGKEVLKEAKYDLEELSRAIVFNKYPSHLI